MDKEYSEEEKMKYLRGFKNSNLPPMEYAMKMKIKVSDLRRWIKEYPTLPSFGIIEVPKEEIIEETQINIPPKTIMKIENAYIKLELKENYDKNLLSNIYEVALKC